MKSSFSKTGKSRIAFIVQCDSRFTKFCKSYSSTKAITHDVKEKNVKKRQPWNKIPSQSWSHQDRAWVAERELTATRIMNAKSTWERVAGPLVDIVRPIATTLKPVIFPILDASSQRRIQEAWTLMISEQLSREYHTRWYSDIWTQALMMKEPYDAHVKHTAM